MTKPLALASLSLASTLAFAGSAAASGFETARFGGEHGTPVNANPTSVYYNPAALAETTGTNILLEYDLALRTASYTHAFRKGIDIAPPTAGANPNDGKGTLFNTPGAPFLGVSTKIKDFALGAAFYVPFGGSETWSQNSAFANSKQYPGAVDGTQRWYSISGSILSLYWSLGAAYKIPGTGLSLGVSGNLINSSINSLRARTFDGSDDLTHEGRSYLDVSGFQGSFGAGALWEAMAKKLWIGGSYQSRPDVAGTMKLNGTLQAALLTDGPATTKQVSVYQALPDIVRWGVRWKPTPITELRLTADWERWSAFQDQCISAQDTPCAVQANGQPTAATTKNFVQNLPRRWQDGVGFRVGGSYWLGEKVELFGGVGYDSNAVPDQHLEPVISDFKQITADLGAQFNVMKNFGFGLQYTNYFCLTRDTTGESLNAVPLAKGGFAGTPSAGPDAGGVYTQYIGQISISANFMF